MTIEQNFFEYAIMFVMREMTIQQLTKRVPTTPTIAISVTPFG